MRETGRRRPPTKYPLRTVLGGPHRFVAMFVVQVPRPSHAYALLPDAIVAPLRAPAHRSHHAHVGAVIVLDLMRMTAAVPYRSTCTRDVAPPAPRWEHWLRGFRPAVEHPRSPIIATHGGRFFCHAAALIVVAWWWRHGGPLWDAPPSLPPGGEPNLVDVDPGVLAGWYEDLVAPVGGVVDAADGENRHRRCLGLVDGPWPGTTIGDRPPRRCNAFLDAGGGVRCEAFAWPGATLCPGHAALLTGDDPRRRSTTADRPIPALPAPAAHPRRTRRGGHRRHTQPTEAAATTQSTLTHTFLGSFRHRTENPTKTVHPAGS